MPTKPSDQRRVQLYTGESFSAIWEHVARQWLVEAVKLAWESSLPTVALVPSRGFAYFLKGRAIEEGISLAGVEFWTLTDLRRWLLERESIEGRLLIREQLHLYLRAWAQKEWEEGDESRLLQSIAAEPDRFLKFWDSLQAAGWNAEVLKGHPLAGFLSRCEERLKKHALRTLPELDFELRAKAGAPCISNLLVIGFDASHWQNWAILSAGARSARKVVVCLLEADLDGNDVEAVWQGSWEEECGEARTLSPATKSEKRAEPVEFLAAENVAHEAQAVVARVLELALKQKGRRIGVAFPAAGPLSREVARLLHELDIPFNDALGHHKPAEGERASWCSWLKFQRNPSFNNWRNLVFQANEENGNWWKAIRKDEKLTVARLCDAVGKKLVDTLLDDMSLLMEFMVDSSSKESGSFNDVISLFEILPPKESFERYLEKTFAALGKIGLQSPVPMEALKARGIGQTLPAVISRPAFLHWLEEMTQTWAMSRQPQGNNFYSNVHLLSITQAQKEEWGHLILTSQSEGVWPPYPENQLFLSGDEISQLNKKIRTQRQRTVKSGSQGEGHWVVEPGKALFLDEQTQRWLLKRTWRHFQASGDLTLTMRVGQEENPEVALLPGLWYCEAYLKQNVAVLNDKALEKIRENTKLLTSKIPQQKAGRVGKEVEATVAAYKARRKEGVPFGEYEFCLASKLEEPLLLGCSDWEKALKRPARVWLKELLGVEPMEDEEMLDLLRRTTGNWAHKWLSHGLGGGWRKREEIGSLEKRAAAQAEMFRSRIESLREGKIPAWWIYFWRQARQMAMELGRACDLNPDWTQALLEFGLDVFELELPGGGKIRVKGRTDLVLTDEKQDIEKGKVPVEAWVVDYKTGKQDSLSPSNVKDGKGLQVVLYGLIFEQKGTQKPKLQLLRPGEELQPESKLDEIKEKLKIWPDLVGMGSSGQFGWYGELRPTYQADPKYPIATLYVDKDLLSEKWSLTHPNLKEIGE